MERWTLASQIRTVIPEFISLILNMSHFIILMNRDHQATTGTTSKSARFPSPQGITCEINRWSYGHYDGVIVSPDPSCPRAKDPRQRPLVARFAKCIAKQLPN